MNPEDVFRVLMYLKLPSVQEDEALPSRRQSILTVFQVPLKPLLGVDLGSLQGQEDLLT
jgi:hypothetical protein